MIKQRSSRSTHCLYFSSNTLYFVSKTRYRSLHFSLCRVDWIKVVGKVPCNFFPPGKCKEQTLWLLKGSFVMPNKFIRVSLKPAFTGILWKEKLAFFMLLLWHNGTQHVVSPLFFDSPFSIFFQNKNKNQQKTWCRLLSTESCQQFVFQWTSLKIIVYRRRKP